MIERSQDKDKDKRMAVVWWDDGTVDDCATRLDGTGWRDWMEWSAARLDFLAKDARRRNNGNGTTRADKFINFFLLFFLHNVFFNNNNNNNNNIFYKDYQVVSD